MAVYRQIHTNFWQDAFVSELTPEERYFYVYLMTNSKTRQCGIFEVSKKIMEVELGYTRDVIDKLIERFVEYGKILYSDETKEIFILNWIKYNFINSVNTITCINKEIKEVKNKNFVKTFFKVCKKLQIPTDAIFKNINLEDMLYEEKGVDFQPINKESQAKEAVYGSMDNHNDNNDEAVSNNEYDESLSNNEEYNYAELTLGEDVEDKTISDVINIFDNNIHLITNMELEKIKYWCTELSCGVVIRAIYEAVNRNVRTMNYINGILNNWFNLGLTNEQKINSYEKEWTKKALKNLRIPRDVANVAAYTVIEDELD